MADYQNRLVSGIFSGFSSDFLHETILFQLSTPFSHALAISIFDPK